MKNPTETLGKIFIAGTGRSGTTILHTIVGNHPEAYAVPYESKFIVEGDGLNSLIPVLCSNFSVTASDLALNRFIEMMNEGMENDGQKYYDRIGKQFYFEPLTEYISNLTDFYLYGRPFPKRFDDRGELLALTRRFISTMFGAPALAAGKKFWVEKTPSNLIAMDLLWDIFPDATIIHIKRDPRAVLFSLMTQDWAPEGLNTTTTYLGHIYWRWMQLKSRLDLYKRRYLEIKLEDLVKFPNAVMQSVSTVAGITNQFAVGGVRPGLVDRWKTEMPLEAKKYVEDKLRCFFAVMGYDLAE